MKRNGCISKGGPVGQGDREETEPVWSAGKSHPASCDPRRAPPWSPGLCSCSSARGVCRQLWREGDVCAGAWQHLGMESAHHMFFRMRPHEAQQLARGEEGWVTGEDTARPRKQLPKGQVCGASSPGFTLTRAPQQERPPDPEAHHGSAQVVERRWRPSRVSASPTAQGSPPRSTPHCPTGPTDTGSGLYEKSPSSEHA